MKTVPVPVDLLQALGTHLANDPAFVRISQLLTGLQAAMKAAEQEPPTPEQAFRDMVG